MDLEKFLLQEKKQVQQLWENRANGSEYRIKSAWLRGFIEADGSFISNRQRNIPLFEITQHQSDKALMEAIKVFFGCGSIRFEDRDEKTPMCVYRMSNRIDIQNKLLPLLSKGFVLSNKQKSYKNWLDNYFPDYEPPLLDLKESFDYDWLYGFTDGDGSFFFRISEVNPRLDKKTGKMVNQFKTGFQVRAYFDLAQIDSKKDLENLRDFFVDKDPSASFEIFTQDGVSHLRASSFKTVKNFIEPLFSVESLQSRKKLDFYLWKTGLFLMGEKYHLTSEGVKAFNKLQDSMNFHRTNSFNTKY